MLTHQDCERIHEAALEVLVIPASAWTTRKSRADARCRRIRLPGGTIGIPRALAQSAPARRPKRCASRTAGASSGGGRDGDAVVVTGNALYITRGRERSELSPPTWPSSRASWTRAGNIDGMVGTAISRLSAPVPRLRRLPNHGPQHRQAPAPLHLHAPGGRLIIEMAQVLLDGAPLRERPIVSTGFSILSPLHWTALALGVFKATAGLGMPVMINSEPLGGGDGPRDAGRLPGDRRRRRAQRAGHQPAARAGPALHLQLGFAHVLDMASGDRAHRRAGKRAAAGRPARRWRGSTGCPAPPGCPPNRCSPDSQAAFEKMMTGLAHAAAGRELHLGRGNLESTLAMSPEALVIDDEIAGYFLRYRRGFEVNDETIALDAVREVGPGDYLSQHTLEHYRYVLSRAHLATRTPRQVGDEGVAELRGRHARAPGGHRRRRAWPLPRAGAGARVAAHRGGGDGGLGVTHPCGVRGVPMSESHDPVAGFDVAALMAPSLRRLGWLAVVFAYLWALPDMATARPFPHWAGLLGPFALLLAGLVSVRRSSGYRASALTPGRRADRCLRPGVGGGARPRRQHDGACRGAGLRGIPGSTVRYRARVPAVPRCGAGILRLAGVAAASVPSCPPGARLPWAGYSSGRSVAASFRALRLAEASELRSWRQAREAMASRADVQRTSKALRDMYALLERTNHELEMPAQAERPGSQGPLRGQHQPRAAHAPQPDPRLQRDDVPARRRSTATSLDRPAARRRPRDLPQPAATCSA